MLYSVFSQSTNSNNSLFSIKNISQLLLFNIASPILYTGFPTNIAGCVANGSNDLSNRQMKTCNSLHQRMQTCELNCLKAGNIFDSRYIAVLELEHNLDFSLIADFYLYSLVNGGLGSDSTT